MKEEIIHEYVPAVKIILTKQKLLFYALLFFTILLNEISIAQSYIKNEEKYRAVHWGVNEGLSQGETYHIIKDINGFLWITTRYGLNRFDGNSFKVYLHQRNNDKSLITDDVREGLVEDSLHNIWIGSEFGVSRYNIRTEDFTNFFYDTLQKSPASIIPFWATKNEVLCMEGESFVTAYNIHSSAKRKLANLDEYAKHTLGISAAYSIFDSSTNSIWCLVEKAKVGLLQIMLSTGQKNFFEFAYQAKQNAQKFADALCYDAPRQCIWINSIKGLLQFTLMDKQFHHINALYKYEQVKDYDRFVGITLDKQNRVWFATRPKGIIIYDPADESVSFPFPADSVRQKDVSFANACIYYDRGNIMWSGFWLKTGIYGILPFNPVVKHYASSGKKDSLNGDFVWGVKDAGAGKIWVNTSNGVFILNTETGIFQGLQNKDFPGIRASNGSIGVVAIDTLAQKAWFYTDSGFFKADMLTKKCTPIVFKTFNNGLTTPPGVPKFDGKEIFFIGQIVFVLNLNNDTAHEILSFSGFPFNKFQTIPVKNRFLFFQGLIDEKDNQTYENKNGKWVRIHIPIDSIRWTSIAYIKENNTYWVAGEKQLFHFDNSFHIIKTYSQDNDLTELPVVGLINDNNGNIWFHTDRSIQELNVATGQIKTMSEADGFEKENFQLLPFADKDANGNIYYGGGIDGSGLDKISPAIFAPTISDVYLKSLTINQKLFPLKASINYTDTLSLKYDQTKIEIETGIINFYSQGESRLRYKLEGKGINESWQYAPYYYTIRYDGLPPGNYKLIMQASSALNKFNGPEKTLFINISPAFWDTWWFRIIAGICAVALIYGLVRWRLRQKYRLQLERSERERQLAKLKQKSTELEMQALRAQMNPHFIFNCLNSINRFILTNEPTKAADHLTKFAKLIRIVLQQSGRSFIPLEDELYCLQLYMDLETLRFEIPFSYEINQGGINTSAVMVPPLLLQPFVENAIWHGLHPKENEKGRINIDLKQYNEMLHCSICDNGVGRIKSTGLADNSIGKKSLGIKLTQHRLELFESSLTRDEAVIVINDLTNEAGQSAGTCVHIKIPVKSV